MRRGRKGDIEKALLDDLEAKGALREQYIDLLADYMSLYDVKKKLIADIRSRGVVYEDVSSVGVKMQKNNPSIKELVTVNRQMLSILKELGLTTENNCNTDDDDL